VVIRDFEWSVDKNEGVWSVYLFFRQMRPASPEQLSLWSEHRRSAYKGSMRHFLWALVHRRVFEEGFEMRVGRWTDSRMWRLIGEDSIHLELFPGTHLLEWTYRGMIRVDYNPQVYPPSFVRLADEFSLVDSSGVVVTPLAYELGGKWAWESMGRLLPCDYSPEDIR
ncbi:MAG TPA: hypothetical protein VMF59_10745, partial [Bacteroidota bacterium]|nr:hypothetical protein [Bacteroidota bacterium]